MNRMSSFLALTKPRITVFILMSAAVGFFSGAHQQSAWTWVVLAHMLAGTALIASGAAALNQWYEREADAKMVRTSGRPIPSGRLSSREAAMFGVIVSAAGFTELWWGANPLTALLALFTLLSYLFVYTPLKQRSPHSTTVGAIPGAMPPLIGFAAAAGTLTWEAWALFAILFIWQFPHFYAIAWMYREDYASAGIRMLPVVEPDGKSTARRIVLCSIALVTISLLPKYLAMAGNFYVVGALILGFVMLFPSFRILGEHSTPRARQVLLASVAYLPLLYGLLIADGAGAPVMALASSAAHASLPAYGSVPDFTLTDQNGAIFESSKQLRGHVWAADFMFTHCPGPCPRMSSQMRQVQKALAGTSAKLVSLTVDPARDTPHVLEKYAQFYGATSGVWFFLTGARETLQMLDREAFKLGDIDGSLDHSTRFTLIDRKGQIRAYYLSSEPDSMDRLIADAKDLLREPD